MIMADKYEKLNQQQQQYQHRYALEQRRHNSDINKLKTGLDSNMRTSSASRRIEEKQAREQLRRLQGAQMNGAEHREGLPDVQSSLPHARVTPRPPHGPARHASTPQAVLTDTTSSPPVKRRHNPSPPVWQTLGSGINLPALTRAHHMDSVYRKPEHRSLTKLHATNSWSSHRRLYKPFQQTSRNNLHTSSSHAGVPIYGRRSKHDVHVREALNQMVKRGSAPLFDPLSMLQCRYLRLSDSNIQQLERQVVNGGRSPGIHAFMSTDDVLQYFNSHPMLTTRPRQSSPVKQVRKTAK